MSDVSNITDSILSDIVLPKSTKIIKMWMILAAIAVLGIILNLGLLIRRKFSTSRTSSTTRSSLFLLGTMAAADTLCLISLLFLLCIRFFALEDHPYFLTFSCKLNVFIMHTTSSFSIWCWLVLSAVRYVAVYRPYTHLKLDKEPRLAVLAVAVFCCVSEIWVVWEIKYDEEFKSCNAIESKISNHLQIFEIIISYFLPVVCITVLDLKVILCRAVWFSSASRKSLKVKTVQQKIDMVQERCISPTSSLKTMNYGNSITVTRTRSRNEMNTSSTRSKRRQQIRILRRCLCITVFDLSMNLPSYLLRLYLALAHEDDLSANWPTILLIEEISQVMYFAQFALNALYLFLIIYDTPRKKSQAPSTQLSTVGLTPRPSRRSNRSVRIS